MAVSKITISYNTHMETRLQMQAITHELWAILGKDPHNNEQQQKSLVDSATLRGLRVKCKSYNSFCDSITHEPILYFRATRTTKQHAWPADH